MKTGYGFTEFENLSEFKTWLNKQNVTRKVTRLQVHHMWMPDYSCWAKDNALRRQYNTKTYHMTHNKWGDIAQHFSVFPDGHIVTGRSLNKTPIGIKGWNTSAICVEIYGNFDSGHDVMTEAQKKAVVGLYGELCKKFKLTPNENTIRPHCWFTAGGTYLGDYSSSKSAKTCPGTKFMGFGNTKSAFKNNFYPMIQAYINGNATPSEPVKDTPKPTTSTKADPNVKALQHALNQSYNAKLVEDGLCGNKTKSAIKSHYLKSPQYKAKAHVTWVQQSLQKLGYSITVDGLYGKGSASTVKKFQKDNKLGVDGIAGISTHLKLIEKLKK